MWLLTFHQIAQSDSKTSINASVEKLQMKVSWIQRWLHFDYNFILVKVQSGNIYSSMETKSNLRLFLQVITNSA
jgi:hypothetical protein